MKELTFSQGRVSFSLETFEMQPCLPDALPMRVRCFYLDENGLIEAPFIDFEEFAKQRTEKKASWLHLSGTISSDFWKELCGILDMADEDVKLLRSPHRRPFFEELPHALFWSLERPSVTDNIDALETVNFFLMEKTLVTRQFSHDNTFTMVAHKLMAKGEQISHFTVDLLAASLLDDLISSFVEVLMLGGTKLESIQNKIIVNPGKEELKLINRAQQIIWIYLNAVWPVETIFAGIARSRGSILTDKGREEFNHRVYDAASVLRLFETYRAMSYNLMDVYVSGLGLRTNETTMILTVIATLFLPPTLIAGIYGMNFTIPELQVSFGYYICLFFMFMVSGGLLFWLKKRGFIQFF